jgi:hypothetical protein
MKQHDTNGADNMTITEEPTSERISATKIDGGYVFLCADGKYGNSVVGFGYNCSDDVVCAMSSRSTKSEWPGIARGVRSGKL